MSLRVIPLQKHSARRIASLTEALLHVTEPTIAYFEWPNSVTVPYIQAISDINLDECAKRGYEVARITGGGRAYIHGHDFSIAYAIHSPKRPNVTAELKTLCASLIDAMQELGIPAELKHRTYVINGKEQRDGYDLEINGQKIAGYAATYKNQRFLIHGAFVYQMPNIPEWLELVNLPKNLSKQELISHMTSFIAPLDTYNRTPHEICDAISKNLDVHHHVKPWTKEEISHAEQLEHQLYSTNEWKKGDRKRGLCLYPFPDSDDPPNSLLGEVAEE